MSDKTFTIGGTSTVDGVNTFRVCNGEIKVREGVLRRAGHTDIKLAELPNPMTRAGAVAYLKTQGVEAIIPVGGKKKSEGASEKPAKAPKAPKQATATAELAAELATEPAAEGEAAPVLTFAEKMKLAKEKKAAEKAAAAQAAADAAFLAAQEGHEEPVDAVA